MSEKFQEHVDHLLQNDPLLQETPKYPNKKKLKDLAKESAERLKEFEKLGDAKSAKNLLPLLAEKADAIKSAAERFQNQFNAVAGVRAERARLEEQLVKERADLQNLTRVEDSLRVKREELAEKYTKMHKEMGDGLRAYVDQLHADMEWA